MMEGCSVCACDEKEVPWLESLPSPAPPVAAPTKLDSRRGLSRNPQFAYYDDNNDDIDRGTVLAEGQARRLSKVETEAGSSMDAGDSFQQLSDVSLVGDDFGRDASHLKFLEDLQDVSGKIQPTRIRFTAP